MRIINAPKGTKPIKPMKSPPMGGAVPAVRPQPMPIAQRAPAAAPRATGAIAKNLKLRT